MRSARLLRLSTALLLLAALLALSATSARAQGWTPRPVSATLRGGGSTGAVPLLTAWIAAYKQLNAGVAVSYAGVGSSQGQRDLVAGRVEFGLSSSGLGAARLEGELVGALHVPAVLSAVTPIYNLDGLQLRFSAESLAGIYLGVIKRWNDPRLAADNPGVVLPDRAITVFYRSDGSGATAIFTDYLSQLNNEWRSGPGAGPSVRWPTGRPAAGSEGVISAVRATRGAIGYVELPFALAYRLAVPPVENAAGRYVAASLDSTLAAAEGVTLPENLVASLVNSPHANAYPIVGYTYFLLRGASNGEPARTQALADFVYWALTEGSGAAVRLGYAPLPGAARVQAIERLRMLTVNGERVFDGPVR